MTDFLRKTSDKETSARMKLEGFISKLLERAEKAESELKELQGEKAKKTKYPKVCISVLFFWHKLMCLILHLTLCQIS